MKRCFQHRNRLQQMYLKIQTKLYLQHKVTHVVMIVKRIFKNERGLKQHSRTCKMTAVPSTLLHAAISSGKRNYQQYRHVNKR